MADYSDSDEKLISEFNEAKFQIYRLHNLWVECKFLRERGKLIHLRWKLDSITIELWGDAKRLDEDIDKKEEKYISKLENLDINIIMALNEKNFSDLYSKLMEKEKLLKEIQEKAGKGSRWKPADDDYM